MKNNIEHSAVKKGSMRADHKYTYREWKNGRWVYYYEDGKGKRHGVTEDERTRIKNAALLMNTLRNQLNGSSSGKRFYSHSTKKLVGRGASWQSSLLSAMERRMSALPERHLVVARSYVDELLKK